MNFGIFSMIKDRLASVRPFVLFIFFITSLLSFLLAWQVERSNTEKLETAVANKISTMTQQVVNHFQLYQYGIRGTRGAIISSEENINRATFRRYSVTRDVENEFPGSRGFGFIRRVPQASVDDFLRDARADGWPDFSIRQLSPYDGDRYVIQYIEPVEHNVEAVGLDIASEPTRKKAADIAMQTGLATLTGPITLVQATGNPLQSFLLLLPIYNDDGSTLGWAYTPLLMDEVMSRVGINHEEVHLSLFDNTDGDTQAPFYQSAEDNSKGISSATREIEIFNRHWNLHLTVQPRFVEALNRPNLRFNPPSLDG